MTDCQQKFMEMGARVYQALGYLIFASHDEREPGYIFTHSNTPCGEIELPQPFAAIGPATREEFISQCDILGLTRPEDLTEVGWEHFTKAVTE